MSSTIREIAGFDVAFTEWGGGVDFDVGSVAVASHLALLAPLKHLRDNTLVSGVAFEQICLPKCSSWMREGTKGTGATTLK
jgi:hypothetical protein